MGGHDHMDRAFGLLVALTLAGAVLGIGIHISRLARGGASGNPITGISHGVAQVEAGWFENELTSILSQFPK